MNIVKQIFNTLDVLYDDKKWGKRIDPDEWNANFKVLEEGHNELATKLNQQVNDIDTAIQAATSNGGQNISVQYDGETKALQDVIDDAVMSDNINKIRLNSDKVIETSADGVKWEATGSSGHIIVDGKGSQMTQRSRLKFNGVTITDDGTNTVIHGIKGDTGDKGEKGDKGDTGATGPIGPKGATGPVIVPTVDSSGIISWELQSEPITPPPVNIMGPQGIPGVQGLQGLQGERGLQGIQGPAGAQGIQGEQGPIGPIGPAGPAGPIGASGAKGDKGEKGDSGVYYGSSEPGETYDVWIDPNGSGVEILTTEEVQTMINESTSAFLTDIDITAEQTSTGATITIGSKSVTLENGYTPVKGIDYYTDEEKTEMVQAVITALPTAEGGAY